MIETKSRSCEGWFQHRNTYKWIRWNHPQRDPLRDPAALTQEGNFLASIQKDALPDRPFPVGSK
jgi:hypothetical protein